MLTKFQGKSTSNLTLNQWNSTQSLGQWNSPQSLNSTPRGHQAPSKDYQNLQLLCSFLERDAAAIGINQGVWKVRDLDKLASEDMLKIVVFLLKGIVEFDEQVSCCKSIYIRTMDLKNN